MTVPGRGRPFAGGMAGPITSTQPAPAAVPDPVDPSNPVDTPDLVAGANLVDGVDVDLVAATARACPGVADLVGGPTAGIATYLPGRRVVGVVVNGAELVVHVRSRWAVPAADLLAQLDVALRPLSSGHRVSVVVAEIDDPPDLHDDDPAPAS